MPCERAYGYLLLCVHGSSEAMGKVSKPVTAVASVAIGPYYVSSRVGVIATSTLACPFPCQNNGVNGWCVTWSQVTQSVLVLL